MHEDAACFDKPTKPLPRKKRPLVYAVNVISKGDSENPSRKKEHSAESTVEKPPLPSAQNGVPPSSCRPSAGSAPPASVVSSDHNNAQMSYLNHPQPQGQHQWLIPVMSPSEGLVYKPYQAPGFVGQGAGGYSPPGSNPMVGNFIAPMYGVPSPSPQYPFPFFPPYGPHGCFPHYGMPIMSSAVFSGSSTDLMHSSARESVAGTPAQNNGTVPDRLNRRAAEEIEVQGSSASSPSERQQPGSRASNTVEGRNMLGLFPTSSPATDSSNSSPRVPAPERIPRVIKVVPHNGISASESAARIFQSIQEERKQYDSV